MGHMVRLEWEGNADHVEVSGEFSNWVGISMVRKLANDQIYRWYANLRMKRGQYLMNYHVDGQNMINACMESNNEQTFNILTVPYNINTVNEASDRLTDYEM